MGPATTASWEIQERMLEDPEARRAHVQEDDFIHLPRGLALTLPRAPYRWQTVQLCSPQSPTV